MMMKREVKGRTYTHTHIGITGYFRLLFQLSRRKRKKKKKGRKNKLNKSIITNKQQRKQKNKFLSFYFQRKMK